MNKDDANSFLFELAELTRKYGIVIGGCGCCGSPFLTNGELGEKHSYRYDYYKDGDDYINYIRWEEEEC